MRVLKSSLCQGIVFWNDLPENIQKVELYFEFKDRQQVITAVLPRSHLNALCAFALYPLYFYSM